MANRSIFIMNLVVIIINFDDIILVAKLRDTVFEHEEEAVRLGNTVD